MAGNPAAAGTAEARSACQASGSAPRIRRALSRRRIQSTVLEAMSPAATSTDTILGGHNTSIGTSTSRVGTT